MSECKPYTPELGQAMYGCPCGEYEAPHFVEAGLAFLTERLCLAMWNRTQHEWPSPTDNTGTDFICDAFEIHAYYWGDDEALRARPNFKCADFEVRWYKHLSRGTTINRPIDANEFFALLAPCLAAVDAFEAETDRLDAE